MIYIGNLGIICTYKILYVHFRQVNFCGCPRIFHKCAYILYEKRYSKIFRCTGVCPQVFELLRFVDFPHNQLKMSRFWAAASSSEGEQGSDSDSFDEAQPVQRQADKKFGATFDESDSGTCFAA